LNFKLRTHQNAVTLKPCSIFACIICFFTGLSALAGLKKPTPDQSDAFFTNGRIPHIKIEIAGTNLNSLRQDPRRNVRARVTEGKTVYEDVAIHLKGAAGSFRPIDDGKPAFTLNFDKFKEDQEFHGLDKLHLNNSVQDPSYMTELLCSELFLGAGVPTPRTTHARVELNGRLLGFYVLKEGFDKQFLRRHFTNVKGNLYDGGFIREITDPLEKDSGEDVANYADLKQLVAAASEPDPQKRWARFQELLDVDCMLTFMALEMMTWHWDGYVMKRNNYRVYHEPTGNKLYFLPHGMDQMFWVAEGGLIPTNPEGLVARSILELPQGRKLYRERVGFLLTNLFAAERLVSRINEIQKRIRPVLAAINEHEARNHDGAVNNLRNQVMGRVAGVQRMIEQPEPKPLEFDLSGVATLATWRVHNPQGGALLDKTVEGEVRTLHIRASYPGSVSWRTRVLLDAGQYRFEGRVKVAGVGGYRSERGEGAGLRISGSPRPNRLSGDADWKTVSFTFPVQGFTREVELVCELSAARGQAWFDLNSLKLRKQ
jgi:spore coat protein H